MSLDIFSYEENVNETSSLYFLCLLNLISTPLTLATLKIHLKFFWVKKGTSANQSCSFHLYFAIFKKGACGAKELKIKTYIFLKRQKIAFI